MDRLTRFFSSLWGIVFTGIIIGGLGILLQKMGNPPNMGVCVACFERDTVGALGLHRAPVVQYIRPEIIGFVFGSMLAALLFREFKARTGSAPIVRFILGAFAMIGALTFLGCPWRACFRLAGGDLNAIPAILGLAVGIAVGVFFLKSGYCLGKSQKTHSVVGWIMPLFMAGLLSLLVFAPKFGDGSPVFFSEKGPGSMHASVLISLGIAIVIGFLAQRTRFCTMGAIRDVILMRDFHLFSGLLALILSAFAANLVFGVIKMGFAGQPIAHSNLLWNFLGMVLAGLSYALAGGCPGRQLFLAGEGDGDSSVFVLGMFAGAAFSHNFNLAARPDAIVQGANVVGGINTNGMIAVVSGIVVCLVLGFTMREKVVLDKAR